MSKLFVATVTEKHYRKGGEPQEPNRDGTYPFNILLQSGTAPRGINTVSGAVGRNMGIQAGKTYLMSYNEGPEHPEYGRQFNFTMLKELNAVEIVELDAKLGTPKALISTTTVAAEEVVVPEEASV